MGMFGRVIMVGNLSCYNQLQAAPSIPALDLAITLKELTIVGFNVYRSDTRQDTAETADTINMTIRHPHSSLAADSRDDRPLTGLS